MPHWNSYNCGTKHFHLTSVISWKWKPLVTRLSNKTSTAWSCAEDQIPKNKNLQNMILNFCTEQQVKYFFEIYLPVREHTWLIGSGGFTVDRVRIQSPRSAGSLVVKPAEMDNPFRHYDHAHPRQLECDKSHAPAECWDPALRRMSSPAQWRPHVAG